MSARGQPWFTVEYAEEIDHAQELVVEELSRAQRFPAMNSAHEGYAVLAEEVEELWAHVKTNQERRDIDAIETRQLGALAYIRPQNRPAPVE